MSVSRSLRFAAFVADVVYLVVQNPSPAMALSPWSDPRRGSTPERRARSGPAVRVVHEVVSLFRNAKCHCEEAR